jgi:putative transposase
MVDKDHRQLSVVRQCKLLKLNRSSYYYSPKLESEDNLEIMKIIDQEYMNYPFFGSRQMKRYLNRQGHAVSRNRVRRLMRKMGLAAIYQKPKTTCRNKEHQVYPYLLRNLEINKSNQVWCSDITYIPIKRGFMYLVAVKDWYSRKVLSWQLSNTLDVSFCLDALDYALAKYGSPEIFNTDQGSQYTSTDFTDKLKAGNIKISMDGKGCWVDNVFIERLWRSLKYECIYLQEFDNVEQLRSSISNWINFYNNIRPHSVFNGKTPKEVYYGNLIQQNLHLAA